MYDPDMTFEEYMKKRKIVPSVRLTKGVDDEIESIASS